MLSSRKGLLILVFSAVALGALAHKFYVSITTIDFQKEKGSLEITMKYFRDDLSLVLSQRDDVGDFKEIEVESSNTKAVNELLQPYIQEHFALVLNGKSLGYKYLGYESDFDMVFIYLEAKAENVESLDVSNSVLMDIYEDQVNIIHYQEGKNVASEALKRNRDRVSFESFAE